MYVSICLCVHKNAHMCFDYVHTCTDIYVQYTHICTYICANMYIKMYK